MTKTAAQDMFASEELAHMLALRKNLNSNATSPLIAQLATDAAMVFASDHHLLPFARVTLTALTARSASEANVLIPKL